MAKATFIQDGLYIDYTAGTAGVSAGDVVILGGNAGKIVGIATQDIPANTTGALTTEGVFDVVKGSTTAAFSTGNTVYINANGTVTTTTTDTKLGVAISDSGTASTTVKVKLNF